MLQKQRKRDTGASKRDLKETTSSRCGARHFLPYISSLNFQQQPCSVRYYSHLTAGEIEAN